MAFKVRRQRRRDNLIRAGLLKFEAFTISSITTKEAPYLKELIKDRQKIVNALEKEALFNNWSQTRYNRELRGVIRDLYLDKGWLITEAAIKRKGKVGKADPWKMLHYYHDEFVQRNPSWESPSRARRFHHKPYSELNPVELDKVREQKQRYREKKAREREH